MTAQRVADLYHHYEALLIACGGSGGSVFMPHLTAAETALIECVLGCGGHVALEHITITVESMHMGTPAALVGRWIVIKGDHHSHHKAADVHLRVNLLRGDVRKWRRGPALLADLAAAVEKARAGK